jgi:hypothetical protein
VLVCQELERREQSLFSKALEELGQEQLLEVRGLRYCRNIPQTLINTLTNEVKKIRRKAENA